jgi:hypothetical protein
MAKDSMKTITWKGYDWIPQERWGQVHHEKSHWWYDASCVSVDDNDALHLTTKYNPKYFSETDKTAWIGVGLVSCTERIGFGTFSVTAKLPQGKNLWPAFWMWSWDTWPPEIDVFEAYSNSHGSYLKPRLLNPAGFWNVQTNIHYTKDSKNKMIKGKTHWFGLRNPAKHFITYSVTWKPDVVEFRYDGRLVRCITDSDILKQLAATKMNVILNNGVTEDVDRMSPPVSDFIIKSFTYEPLNNEDDISDWDVTLNDGLEDE